MATANTALDPIGPQILQDLTTNNIHEILTNLFAPFTDQICFFGVFPFDYFPFDSFLHASLPRSICCVVNTDPSWKSGQHWVAFFREATCKGVLETEIEFFDSYGYSPAKYNFPNGPVQMQINHTPLQSPVTNVCGYYCILFLYLRACSVKLIKMKSRFLHVIKFLQKLGHGSTLDRDIQVKRIILKNRINPLNRHFTCIPSQTTQHSQSFEQFQLM